MHTPERLFACILLCVQKINTKTIGVLNTVQTAHLKRTPENLQISVVSRWYNYGRVTRIVHAVHTLLL